MARAVDNARRLLKKRSLAGLPLLQEINKNVRVNDVNLRTAECRLLLQKREQAGVKTFYKGREWMTSGNAQGDIEDGFRKFRFRGRRVGV